MATHIKLDPRALPRLMRELSSTIPQEMVVRELVMNAIEANNRGVGTYNSEKEVIIDQLDGKLTITNFGGEFLSQEIAEKHLAQLSNTGNDNSSIYAYAPNKGIGAKISYLPQNKEGLTYECKDHGESPGITFIMNTSDDGYHYQIASTYCDSLGLSTDFPNWDPSDNPYFDDRSATRAICNGKFSSEETWGELDAACRASNKANRDGTGWGFFKYLNRRFWDLSNENIKVAIFDKNRKHSQYRNIVGLKPNLLSDSTLYGAVDFVHVDNQIGLNIKAHWFIVEKATSNFGIGYTGLLYKNEIYHDDRLAYQTRLKNLRDCGIIFRPRDVFIIFEVIEGKNTGITVNTSRTHLYVNTAIGPRAIDMSLLFDNFRKNIPQAIVDWLKEQSPGKDELSINDWLEQQPWGFDIRPHKKRTNNVVLLDEQQRKSYKEMEIKKERKQLHQDARSLKKMQNGKFPNITIFEDSVDVLYHFDLAQYCLQINKGHPIIQYRMAAIESIIKKKEPNLVFNCEEAVEWILRYAAYNVTYRISEIYNMRQRSMNIKELKEEWSSEKLESAWGCHDHTTIIKHLKDTQKAEQKIRSIENG